MTMKTVPYSEMISMTDTYSLCTASARQLLNESGQPVLRALRIPENTIERTAVQRAINKRKRSPTFSA